MNLLAIDTSTERMSIALQGHGQATPWVHESAGGALTSLHLIAQIQDLMAQAGLEFQQLDAIAFGAGPGSFTGLRSACAVAQGLGFGAAVPLLPVDTLLAVAEQARLHVQTGESLEVLALLDARMDEMYAASYRYHAGVWTRRRAPMLLKPEQLQTLLDLEPVRALAGNVFEVYGQRLANSTLARVAAWPGAAAMLRLAPALLQAGAAVPPAQALPIYIRDKVAQTTQERLAIKSGAGAA